MMIGVKVKVPGEGGGVWDALPILDAEPPQTDTHTHTGTGRERF